MKPITEFFANIPTSKIITRFILPLVIFVFILVATGFAWDYFVSQKEVTLIPTPGTTIRIGTKSGDDPAIDNQIASTTTKKAIRLRPGLYVLEYTGGSDYRTVIEQLTIDESTTIKTPSLVYTEEKLGKLLDSQKTDIHNSVSLAISDPDYSIDKEALYEKGDWYGASLKPSVWYYPTMAVKNLGPVSGNRDMERVILQKVSGQWKIAAGPSVIFSIDDYPKIPEDVIRGTNSLGFDS